MTSDDNTFHNMQNCNFCKTVLMLIIVFYHAGMFWTGDWFTAIRPAQTSQPISIAVHWMGTFHVYAFTLISGYIYYYIRFQRGGYEEISKFIINKTKRLVVPYIFIATLWVIPLSNIFFHLNCIQIVKSYTLGESPSQLWFLLMLFWVFIIAYPLSKYFRSNPISSASVVIGCWLLGIAGNAVLPNILQIFTALQFIPYFWIGFEIRRWQTESTTSKNMIFNPLIGAAELILNIIFFLLSEYNAFEGLIGTAIGISASFASRICGALMAFNFLMLLACRIQWHTRFFIALSNASYPIYLFHQQIIYFILWQLNGHLPPFILMLASFIIATITSWMISYAITSIPIFRPLIGLRFNIREG